MSRLLVSLVSDQTIPNVLFIKEMKEIDRYVFVSTGKMEKDEKVGMICRGAGIDVNRAEVVVVEEDSLSDIEDQLKTLNIGDNDSITVNLTAGTKIMSIGVYNFFRARAAGIYYLPIGKNIYKKIFPYSKHRLFDLKTRIHLKEYLYSHGIEIKNAESHNLFQPTEETTDFFRRFLNREFPLNIFPRLREFRKHPKMKRKGFVELTEGDDDIREFCASIGWDNLTRLNRDFVEYLTGGWFEEYVFTTVKTSGSLRDEDIGLNFRIKHKNADNEFDVMFVHDNALHVVECKTGLHDNKKSLLNDAL